MISKLKNAVNNIKVKRSKPLHIEFNLTDYCNLNCKGCTHYSPLAPAEFQDLNSLEESMSLISSIKNVDKIEEIYLIGGETLLYPHLKDAIKLGRSYFPNSSLRLFTNGLLLPKMDDEFWKICKDNNCIISLTIYPVKFPYEKIEDLCREKGVQLEVFGDRGADDSFFKFPLDPLKKQNGMLSHFRCFSHGCITVDKGRIFPCSISACIGHLNKKFATYFKWQKGDFIPVEELKDANELLRLRDHPVPFCKYCCHSETVKYGLSKREDSEWLSK